MFPFECQPLARTERQSKVSDCYRLVAGPVCAVFTLDSQVTSDTSNAVFDLKLDTISVWMLIISVVCEA